jgi:hypothetical protein
VATKWREVVRQGLLRNVLYSDAITQDNVGAPVANGCNCGYDPRTDATFLAANPQLNLPANFSSAAYITGLRHQGVEGDALMVDVVIKQKILFDFKSQLQAWIDIYASVKAEAVTRGVAEPAVYGNVHIIETVYSVVYGARFRKKFTLEDAIGSHACSLEANMKRTCV